MSLGNAAQLCIFSAIVFGRIIETEDIQPVAPVAVLFV